MAKRSRAYYIWCDESDTQGLYYSNFYGGILIRSADYLRVLSKIKKKFEELGVFEEVKWQKVNAIQYERYEKIVDFIFDLLEDDLIKIRIFFRHNKNVPHYQNRAEIREEYSHLYYQFIKHSFGFAYSNPSGKPVLVRIVLDEMPIGQAENLHFRNYLAGLSNDPSYRAANIRIKAEDIIEVDSHKELPLQLLDLILGAISSRLNERFKIKNPETNKRGIRTKLKEKLYKHIYYRLNKLRPGINIGVSTGITDMKQNWTNPYAQWSFVPAEVEVDQTKTKRYQKGTKK